MLQALAPGQGDTNGGGQSSSNWLSLPGLCCQAAGGDPQWADHVTAAWFLLYRAAHLMDSVQDQDEPDDWWADLGPGAALGAATGLFFTASAILEDLHNQSLPSGAGSDIVRRFSESFLTMSSGQHLDLTRKTLTLEEYWQVAEAKSGAFFGLACWAGARLASAEEQVLEAYHRFGIQIGLLIQIADDLDELRKPLKRRSTGGLVPHSLPVIYALEVLPDVGRKKLNSVLLTAASDEAAAREAQEILDKSGAGLYLVAEFNRHLHLAENALQKTGGLEPALAKLRSLLERFNPARNLP